MKKLSLLIILLYSGLLNAQNYQNVEAGYNTIYKDGIETNDYGFLLPVSHIDYKNQFDLIKLNINLEKKYKISFSYPSNAQILVRCMLQLADGSLVLGGNTMQTDTVNGDAFLLLLNSCYEIERFIVFNEKKNLQAIERLFYNSKSKEEYTIRMDGSNNTQTGNSIIYINSNSLYNNVLDRQSTYVLNATDGKDIISTSGQHYFTGETYRKSLGTQWNKEKLIIAKADTNRNPYWEKIFILNDTNRYYFGRDICFADDNETQLLILGDDRQPNKEKPFISAGTFIMKTDTAGNIEWKKMISDTAHYEVPLGMGKIDNNKFVVTTNYFANDTLEPFQQCYGKVYLIDSNSNVKDTVFIGQAPIVVGKTRVSKILNSLTITHDKKIFIAGQVYNSGYDYDAFATKLNADLTLGTKVLDTFKYDTQCTKTLKDTTYTLPAPEIITVVLDSFYYTPVKSENWTLSVIPQPEQSKVEVRAYPNPFNTAVTLEVEQNATVILYTLLGETLSSQQLEAGTHSLNTESLAAGVYFIKLTYADGRSGVVKLVKECR